jgi:hypothetical protein
MPSDSPPDGIFSRDRNIRCRDGATIHLWNPKTFGTSLPVRLLKSSIN